MTFDTLVYSSQRPDLVPDQRQLEETLSAALVGSNRETVLRILQTADWSEFTLPPAQRFAYLVWPELNAGRPVDGLVFQRLLDAEEGSEFDKEEVERWLAEAVRRSKLDPPSLGLVASYLNFFALDADRRNALAMAQRAVDQLTNDPAASAAQVAADLSKLVFDLDPARRLSGHLKSEADSWGAFMTALEASQQEGDFLGLNTGFQHFNNLANGLEAGSLFVLAASPSTGKTTWVKQLVDQVATLNAEAACLFVSYEQSARELRVKTLSRLSGVQNRYILRGRLDQEKEGWKRVSEAGQRYQQDVAGRVFVVEADNRMTVDRVRLAAQNVQLLTGCQQLLVAVDYLQIVPTERDYSDPRSRVDAVLSDLRRLARDLKATVLAIASVGRMSYGLTKGSLDVFKESGNVEYTADLAGVLVQDRDIKGDAPLQQGWAQQPYKRVYLDIVKNRNGEQGRIHFDFFPTVSAFREDPARKTTDPLPEGDSGPVRSTRK